MPYNFLRDIKPTLHPVRKPERSQTKTSTAHLAGSRFNELVHPRTVLLQFGWTLTGESDNQEHYHYPNAQGQQSATIYLEDQHCSIWSETACSETALELHHSYDTFGLWTALKHGGDFALAHADLEQHGVTDLTDLEIVTAVIAPAAVSEIAMQWTSDVTPVAVEWLWPGWLPAGKLVTLDGDPATGKSTLTLDIAARLTTGQDWPDGSPAAAPACVLLLSGEDDLDDTIVWRLMAAGADLGRVAHIQGMRRAGIESPFTIPGDLGQLEALIEKTGAALVIVDVLNEYLDERVDGHKDQSVRRVLHLMKVIAARTNATILMLRHLRKEGSDKAVYRGGGSIGIVGAARAGWTVGIHPEDEAVRVLAAVKMNLATKPQALGFKLLSHPDYPCAQIHWTGVVDLGADELLNPGRKADPDEASELKQAMDAIKQVLADGREVWAKIFMDELKELGISSITIKRARARMNVLSRRIGKPDEHGEMGWKVWLPKPHDE